MKYEPFRVLCNEEPAEAAAPGGAAPTVVTPKGGEPTAVIDPASVVVLNDAGGSPDGQPVTPPAELVIPNASTVLAATPVDHLTSYVNGLPMGQLEELADFLCPRIDAGLSYEYEIEPMANQLGKVEDDVVGYNGLPGVVQLDPGSTGTGRLLFRGLELPYGHTDQALDASIPGRSVAQGEERRTRRLNAFIERGRLARLIALMAASTSTQDLDFSSDNDPINALDDEITELAESYAVPKSWIRVLFGSTGWKTLRQHGYLTGGGSFSRTRIDKAWIADQLELPVDNIMVSSIQAVSSKQGKTAAKAAMLGGTLVYFFVQPPSQGGLPEDPGWAKTFAMRLNGQYKYVYRNVTHQALNVFNVGVAYYENIAAIDTSAIVLRTVSTT